MKPYALSDKTIKQLTRYIVIHFQSAKRQLSIRNFDELNVFHGVNNLYDDIAKNNRQSYYDLFVLRYIEVWLYTIALRNVDSAEELLEVDLMFGDSGASANGNMTADNSASVKRQAEHKARERINDILSTPNPITHYAYDSELLRKRDRLIESVNSANGNQNKKAEMNKAMRYITAQSIWYSDITSDDANVEAMRDAGVEYVQWNTQRDGKVCDACRKRDKKIYKIYDVPDKPHPNCRCWLSPARWTRIEYR